MWCRSLNTAINIHIRRPTVNSCKNLNQPPLILSFIKERYDTRSSVRFFSVFENQFTTSKWLKQFADYGAPKKVTGIRSFRQKVFPSSKPKTRSILRQHDVLRPGKRSNGTEPWKELIRPMMFTIAFSACSFSGAALWKNENTKRILSAAEEYRKSSTIFLKTWGDIKEKRGKARQEINIYWNNLSQGEKMFIPIFAINVMVFALWQAPALRPVMLKYFTLNLQTSNKGLPMILSAFSHQSLLHLGSNMFVLHSFAGPIVSLLGKEQFLGLYLSSCVITSFFSHVAKVASGRIGASLGASGAICTVLGVFGTLIPDARLQIIFLPFFSFTASLGIKCLMALDTMGLIAKWQVFDHAAHLSGVLFGIWWCYQGNEVVWKKANYLIQWLCGKC